ncbi:membrane protein insertion efficiency factor YidD [Demequina sp. NBRC 110051]|uniref:membrane protein insertion efficiency factor YidD n=1 Tax=Demequina sp. NBRC 110051 TaxID=1570340 RepID=UPI000A0204C1|nr:membrane protein insertion efficiency factor YidD [Demequina sp. NBRC 110051]
MSARAVARSVMRVPALALAGLIRLYQLVISPLTGPTCKYYPSCSHYGLTAVRRHGAVRGGALAVWRVLRCNPWSNGGVDDVPAKGEPLFRRTTMTRPEASASATAN